jgi:hypothetical protein
VGDALAGEAAELSGRSEQRAIVELRDSIRSPIVDGGVSTEPRWAERRDADENSSRKLSRYAVGSDGRYRGVHQHWISSRVGSRAPTGRAAHAAHKRKRR